MILEILTAKRYLGARFGIGETIPDGVYPIPIYTSKGKAFMRYEVRNNEAYGSDNFKLFWDEALTLCFDTTSKPFFVKESKFSAAFRKLNDSIE